MEASRRAGGPQGAVVRIGPRGSLAVTRKGFAPSRVIEAYPFRLMARAPSSGSFRWRRQNGVKDVDPSAFKANTLKGADPGLAVR